LHLELKQKSCGLTYNRKITGNCTFYRLIQDPACFFNLLFVHGSKSQTDRIQFAAGEAVALTSRKQKSIDETGFSKGIEGYWLLKIGSHHNGQYNWWM